MEHLPAELIAAIAEYDDTVCWLLWLWFDHFRAIMQPQKYVNLFRVVTTAIEPLVVGGITINNYVITSLFGHLHSFNDQPAGSGDGFRMWKCCGKFHRGDDDPTLIYETADDSYMFWHRRGKYHRDGNLPAWITPTFASWYVDGVRRSSLYAYW